MEFHNVFEAVGHYDPMSRDDILALVVRLYDLVAPKQEKERMKIANILSGTRPNSKIIDLIYQDMRNLTPQQVVDEAFQREADHARTAGSGRVAI